MKLQFKPTAEADSQGTVLVADQVEIVRRLESHELDEDEVGPMFEIEYDNGKTVHAFADELSYPAYEQPSWQAQPLTLMQYIKLSVLCERYHVPFDPAHYRTWSMTASMTKGFAEGWVGGIEHAPGNLQGNRSTIMVGVAPNGDSHS